MKIIHVPFCFHPEPVGGTEIYVEALARHLQAQGFQNVIAAPGKQNQVYLYNQLLVRRFAVPQDVKDVSEIYGEGSEEATAEFSKILDEEVPDLLHLHAFTRGVSLRLLRAAKQRQIPTIFTYHTPTVSCARGTLMRWGNEVCDGKLNRKRCTACVLHGRGLNRPSSTLLSALPPAVSAFAGQWRQGKLWTALRMSELVALQQKNICSLFSEVDHIVAVSHWIKRVLQHNGVSEEKITVCRHGLAHEYRPNVTEQSVPLQSQLRLIFLGRLEEVKGIDIVVNALQSLPNASIALDIYGISQNIEESLYLKKLKAVIARDKRIRLYPPVAGSQVVSLLQNYDLLVVPSRWLETGPLVVLEAFAAGIPVLGSKLGGIAEWVVDGVNGLLVENTSVEAWCYTLERIVENRSQIAQLATNIQPPRSMTEVAGEMIDLYKQIIAG